MTDLDELEKLAKAATPGLRAVARDGDIIDGTIVMPNGDVLGYMYRDGDVEFTVAANPETVLTFIARVRELEADVARLEKNQRFLVGPWEE